jgi:predicted transcriptional regulator
MNIKELLIKIKESGLSDRQIAKEIGASQSLVTRLRNGDRKSTSFERGTAIKELAKQRLPDLQL